MRDGATARLSIAALAVRVHCEAFWLAPAAYLTAAKWWALRKRVRAQGQFAQLLGRTSRAYELWALKDEAAGHEPSPPGTPPFIALVFGDAKPADLGATLASLAAEHFDARLIGDEPAAALRRFAATIDGVAAPWLLLIRAGDRIAPGAAQAYRAAIAKGSHRAIFADDDRLAPSGQRTAPHFKPDWNADLHCHHDYLTGACIVQAGAAEIEAVADEPDWAAALVAHAVAQGGGAGHVRQVLHHRHARLGPRLPLPALPIAADLPRVSVIIPTRNRVDLLATCLEGLEGTDHPDLEVILVDNDSDDPATIAFLDALPARNQQGRAFRVLRHPGPFNYAAINNRAVGEAQGELICLLNNDIAMLQPDWLAIMATQALREEVGAVGAQLLYPDGRIQHAGVVIGVGNAAGHAHRFLQPEQEGYFRRHALPQFVAAVTAACLVVRRERFLAVGGLDEANFPVAFNDVDLCLRLNARGWQSLYEPRAVLVHHESVSRGFDHDPVGAARFSGELAALQRLWQTDQIVDPFHHPQLSRAAEQFVLAL